MTPRGATKPVASPDPPRRPRRVPGVIVHLIVHLMAVWLLLSALHLLLSFGIDRSVVHEAALPAAAKRTLVADEMLLLAAATIIAGVPLLLIARLRRRSRWPRRIATGVVLIVTWALFMLLGSSWSAFRSVGVFLDVEGFTLFATNAVQFIQHVTHMEPWSVVSVPLAVTLAVGVVCGFLPRCVTRVPARAAVGVVAVGAGLLILLGIAAATGTRTSERPDGASVNDAVAGFVYTVGELHESCRDERTGPLRHVWADVRRRLEEPRPLDIRPIPFDWHRIVTSDAYAAGVGSFQKHNVILVLVESLRSDQLVSGGSRRDVMPTVDRLAAQGRVFRNHYTQASHSNYADLCPLTSHFPLRSARTHIYPAEPSYPRLLIYDVLKALGYRTAVISSQNENWGGMLNYLQSPGLDHLFHSETFDGPTYVPHGDTGFETYVKGAKRSGKIDDRFTIDETIRWIDEAADQPFFMYVNLQNSHLPYDTPADFPRRFGRDDLPFTIRFNGYPRSQINAVKDEYANALAYVDSQFSRLIDHLEQRGLDERTLIVVTGDTGQAFYEHGFAAHANMIFNEVMQTPLVICGPGVPRGADDRPAQHVDIPPTLFGLLGLPTHPGFQGDDLLVPDRPVDRPIFLVAQCPSAHQLGVIQGDFKLLHDLRSDRRLLFNLAEDPAERFDVAARHATRVYELTGLLDTWHHQQLEYYRNVRLHSTFYPPRLSRTTAR